MKDAARGILLATLAIGLSLGLVLLVLALCGYSPLQVIAATNLRPIAWLTQPTKPVNLRNMAVIATTMCPLILTGLAAGVAFRCGVFNIGAAGQEMVGALAGLLIAVPGTWGPLWLVIAAALAAAVCTGAIWGFIATLLDQFRGVPIVLSTILLNFIALHLLGALVKGPLHNPHSSDPQSAPVPAALQLPIILTHTNLHAGILIALAAAVILWLIQQRFTLGFEMLATGLAPRTARAVGIPAAARQALVMLLSGGLAGLSGAIQFLGVTHVLNTDLVTYGFTGIAVALLGRLNPLGIVAAALFFATLDRAATNVELSDLGIRHDVADIVKGIVILAMLGGSAFLTIRRLRQGGNDESPSASTIGAPLAPVTTAPSTQVPQ